MVTKNQKEQIIALTIQGLTNRAIAEELDMKYPTVCHYKAEFKRQGIILPIKMGRPAGGNEITQERYEMMTPKMQEKYKQQELKRIMETK